MADKFSIRTSYWEDYRVTSIHMYDHDASCRLSIYNEERDVANISDLYVSENERQKGLGNELLNKCIEIAEDSLCRFVKIHSDKSWKMDWYIRHGFMEVYSCGTYAILKKELNIFDKAKAPTLIGHDYSGGRCGYRMPAGYEFDSIRNDEIILKPKGTTTPPTDPNAEHY